MMPRGDRLHQCHHVILECNEFANASANCDCPLRLSLQLTGRPGNPYSPECGQGALFEVRIASVQDT
jgi:hypothetical protein